LLEEDRILWAPGLRSLALTRSPVLHRALQAGDLAGPLGEFLAQQGYLAAPGLEAPAPRPPRTHLLPGGCVLVEDGPLGQALTRPLRGHRGLGVAAFDSFCLPALQQAEETFQARGLPVRVYALAGDGEQGWIYVARAGRDPCLRCFLGRWLSALPGDPALDLFLERGLTARWQPALPPQAMAALVLRRLGQPGRACLVGPRGTGRGRQFLPLPGCSCRPGPGGELVGPLGIVKELWPWSRRPWIYGASLGAARRVLGRQPLAAGAGCAWERPGARVRAVGEALERYSAAWLPPGQVRRGPLEEPWGRPVYHPSQYALPGFPYRPPDQTPVPLLTVQGRGGTSLAPLRRVLLLEDLLPGEPPLGPSLSHGLACAADLARARARARAELLERDALARFWARTCQGRPCGRRLQVQGPPGLRLTALEVPCLGGLRAVAVLVRDQRGRPAWGGAADVDLTAALSRAVLEGLHNRRWLLRHGDRPPAGLPASFAEHALWWWHHPEALEGLALEGEAEALAGQEELFWRDLTPPDVEAAGFRVVRVLSPGLLFLPERHDAWPLGLARWAREIGEPLPPRLPHPFA
jgi:ribosomal protein S12 methylthiotransferase accessory factor